MLREASHSTANERARTSKEIEKLNRFGHCGYLPIWIQVTLKELIAYFLAWKEHDPVGRASFKSLPDDEWMQLTNAFWKKFTRHPWTRDRVREMHSRHSEPLPKHLVPTKFARSSTQTDMDDDSNGINTKFSRNVADFDVPDPRNVDILDHDDVSHPYQAYDAPVATNVTYSPVDTYTYTTPSLNDVPVSQQQDHGCPSTYIPPDYWDSRRDNVQLPNRGSRI